MAKTAAERQRERRERLRQEGTRELLVTLDPAALKALDRLCKSGQTASMAICFALRQSVAGLTKPESKRALTARLNAERDIEKAKAKTAEALLELSKRGVEIQDFDREEDGVFRPVRD